MRGKKMEVTLYAICRNEEKNVEKFVKNSKLFSNTVVVDTGSTDNTVKLLRDAGITVYENPQEREQFNFSDARNQALSYVETEWACSLDFNEDIEDFNPNMLESVEKDFTLFQHERYDKLEGEDEPRKGSAAHPRIHRTKNYKWTNAVHEIPLFVPTAKYKEEVSVNTNIKITKEVVESVDKQLFYLSICEREVNQKVENPAYYLWFIFMHYYKVQDYETCLEHGLSFLSSTVAYFDSNRVAAFNVLSEVAEKLNNETLSANFAFHALSESMSIVSLSNDQDDKLNNYTFVERSLISLLKYGLKKSSPDIVLFATCLSDKCNTEYKDLRRQAIQALQKELEDED